MITRTTLIWSVIISLLVGGFIGYAISNNSPTNSSNQNTSSVTGIMSPSTDKQIALYTNMQKLWSDHVFWTREYIINAVTGSPATSNAANRLMKNQEDIGSAIGTYYDKDAGNQLTSLLKQHISIAVEIVSAAKAKDQAKLQDNNTRWQNNADQIATFLSQANPNNWPEATLKDMMRKHLSTTSDELNTILNKQYDKSVTNFDTVLDHIIDMSDTLSAGIIKQFPDKF